MLPEPFSDCGRRRRRQEQLAAELGRCVVRREPLGRDRHGARYWYGLAGQRSVLWQEVPCADKPAPSPGARAPVSEPVCCRRPAGPPAQFEVCAVSRAMRQGWRRCSSGGAATACSLASASVTGWALVQLLLLPQSRGTACHRGRA